MTKKKEKAKENPKCFGTFERVEACLKECDYKVECMTTTPGKVRRRIPSRKKAIKAFCKSCNGGSMRAGCSDFSCPFYCYLREYHQLAGPADMWWERNPVHKWEEAEQESRRQKRVIKQDTNVDKGPDEDLDDDQDEEEEKEEEEEEEGEDG